MFLTPGLDLMLAKSSGMTAAISACFSAGMAGETMILMNGMIADFSKRVEGVVM
jgi:hypothetical protein